VNTLTREKQVLTLMYFFLEFFYANCCKQKWSHIVKTSVTIFSSNNVFVHIAINIIFIHNLERWLSRKMNGWMHAWMGGWVGE
jgi:hypothetical protein